MSKGKILFLACFLFPIEVSAYVGGKTLVHNHSSNTQGGTLSNLNVTGTLSWGTAPLKSTGSASGSINLSTSGVIVGASSITAASFWGDGANLTNIGAGAINITTMRLPIGNGTAGLVSYSTFTRTAVGNLGIGASNPVARIHISSTDVAATQGILIDGNGGMIDGIVINSNAQGGIAIGTNTAGGLTAVFGPVPGTNAANVQLDVASGYGNSTDIIRFKRGATVLGMIGRAGATNVLSLSGSGNFGNAGLHVDASDNIGVGTVSPGRIFAVDAGASNNYISSFSASGITTQMYADSSGAYWFAGNSTLGAGGPMIYLDNVGAANVNKGITLGFAGSGQFTIDGTGAVTLMPRISSQTLVIDGNTAASIKASGSIENNGLIGQGVSGSATGDGLQHYYYATSIDGVTESSGCAVILSMSNANTTGTLQFTSTTTANTNGPFGVLLDNSCAPGNICKIGVLGIFRINTSGAIAATNTALTSTTRCAVTGGAISPVTYDFGTFLAADSAGSAWLMLGGNEGQ